MNGRPYDHVVTDIVIHGMKVFSPPIDALIAEIDALDGDTRAYAGIKRIYAEIPELDLPARLYGKNVGVDPEIEKRLRDIRRRCEADARERGWDPSARLAVIRSEVRERWS